MRDFEPSAPRGEIRPPVRRWLLTITLDGDTHKVHASDYRLDGLVLTITLSRGRERRLVKHVFLNAGDEVTAEEIREDAA